MTEDPLAAYNRLATDLAFADQIRGDAKRTLFVHPDKAEQIQAEVTARGLDDVLTVMASPLLDDPGKMLVADTPAFEASWQQALQRLLTNGFGWGG